MSDRLPSFLGVTPFGAYCKLCKLSLSIQTGIMRHGKEYHPDDDFKNAVVMREVHRQMKLLRELHANDLTPFLTDKPTSHPTWFCTSCFTAFTKSSNYHRHFELQCYRSCAGASGGKMPCFITVCGRFSPKSCTALGTALVSTAFAVSVATTSTTVSVLTDDTNLASATQRSVLAVESDSKVPPPLLTALDKASKVLEPFVRPDEDVRDLALIYYPLLSPGFEGKMREYIAYAASQAAEDATLRIWLEAGHAWLDKYAAGHIANVSANVRSRLAEFEQKELEGGVVGTRTFSLRRGVKRLKGELDSVLRFFYRYPSTLFDAYKTKAVQNSTVEWMIESAIIPKILFTAAAEEPDDHGKLPVACV